MNLKRKRTQRRITKKARANIATHREVVYSVTKKSNSGVEYTHYYKRVQPIVRDA